ncbi:hypothetical protein LJC48_00415 [Desulfovibrio sp. OttesenSCG-928-C06]|nr:hypothetical protein [Desulfovibrio sp. OttesenSCG-928-C06]
MTKRTFFALFLAMLALCLVIPVSGCGKAGAPKPRKSSRSFVWQQVDIVPAGKCLEVNAVMSGVYTNLNSVLLEIDGVSGPEDCPGCPFQPSETYKSDKLSEIFNPSTGTLKFSYCPREQADAYRARLIGTNIYDTTRHAVSTERMIVMP